MIKEKLIQISNLLTQRNIFGFLSPYASICEQDKVIINNLINTPTHSETVDSYEQELCDYIAGGNGRVITFGAGRMAFYSLLKVCGIGIGDEVCLTGFTCAVMANAVLRTGATPVYVDIDQDTLGMSPSDLKRKLTSRTKVVVPQHSFGIPCEIDTIVEIAHERGLFVIEDCAISLGSKFKGKYIGTWGDASIFSSDHTKPLNTLIGGFAYTSDKELADILLSYRTTCDCITDEHIVRTIYQYIKEMTFEADNHKRFVVNSCIDAVLRKMHLPVAKKPYLQYESASNCFSNNDYPYPAKLHPALAYIGSKSLRQYIESIPARVRWLQQLMDIIKTEEIPEIYFNPNAVIVPLRLAFLLKEKSREDFNFIDDWVWFKQPIVATSEPLENFGYIKGSCPVSEFIGDRIMNLPMILDPDKQMKFLKLLRNVYH